MKQNQALQRGRRCQNPNSCTEIPTSLPSTDLVKLLFLSLSISLFLCLRLCLIGGFVSPWVLAVLSVISERSVRGPKVPQGPQPRKSQSSEKQLKSDSGAEPEIPKK